MKHHLYIKFFILLLLICGSVQAFPQDAHAALVPSGITSSTPSQTNSTAYVCGYSTTGRESCITLSLAQAQESMQADLAHANWIAGGSCGDNCSYAQAATNYDAYGNLTYVACGNGVYDTATYNYVFDPIYDDVETCNSSPNDCGQVNGGISVNGGSCNVGPPADPAGYGSSCTSGANSCGQTNSGTIACDGSCPASTPANPSNLGQSCASPANSCGQTNTGTYKCDGSCSAPAPSDSGCTPTAVLSATPSTIILGNSQPHVVLDQRNLLHCSRRLLDRGRGK